MTDALLARGALVAQDGGFELTAAGDAQLALSCLDWSERRPHLAGALGAALAECAVANGWVLRRPNDRALTVTTDGTKALRRAFGIDLEQLAA